MSAFNKDESHPAPYTQPLACFALVKDGEGVNVTFKVIGMSAHHHDNKEIEFCEDQSNFIGYLSPMEALNRYAKFLST